MSLTRQVTICKAAPGSPDLANTRRTIWLWS